MLMRKGIRVVLALISILGLVTFEACKKPKIGPVEWTVTRTPGGGWQLEHKVSIQPAPVLDVQTEVNNFVDVDIEDVANPWEPDPNAGSQMTITVTTDTGYVASSTFATVYDPIRSGQYTRVDIETTPRAYVPQDLAAVGSFINAALANAVSTVTLQVNGFVIVRLTDPNTPSGCYHNYQRNANSGGIDTYGSFNFNYTSPADGGETCNGRPCPILQ